MDEISSLAKKLANIAASRDHLSTLHFVEGDTFAWNPDHYTITYNSTAPHLQEQLLHEFGHALLSHAGYQRDIQLIQLERDAWTTAQSVASTIGYTIDPDYIDEALDTYREWLHSRSVCPECKATGVQVAATSYRCLGCHSSWTVNEARTCALRRYRST